MEIHCPDHPDEPLTEDIDDSKLLCLECDRTFQKPSPSHKRSKVKKKKESQHMDSILEKGSAMISSDAVKMKLDPKITQRADFLFKKVVKPKTNKNDVKAIAAACLQIALREENAPRTFNEMCTVTGVPAKKIGDWLINIQKMLKLKTSPISTEQIMKRFCDDLKLPSTVVTVANQIAEKVKDLPFMGGRTASSITAVSIYLAAKSSGCIKSKKEISKAMDISADTINEMLRRMKGHEEKLLSKDQ